MPDKFKFTCVVCKRELESDWTEAEAEEELKKNFPGHKKEDCELTCDDCYAEIRKGIN